MGIRARHGRRALYQNGLVRAVALLLTLVWAKPSVGQPAGYEAFDGTLGLASGEVVSIAEDTEGYVWAATFAGGVHRFDGKRFQRFGRSEGLTSSRVRRIRIDRGGHVRVATLDGVFLFDGHHFRRDPALASAEPEAVNDVLVTSAGVTWLATLNGVVRAEHGTLRRLRVEDGLAMNETTALAEGPNDTVWIGTTVGLSRYANGALKTWHVPERGIHDPLALHDEFITRLLVGVHGELWVATDQGVQWFVDDAFHRLDLGAENHSLYVLDLLIDARGRLRMATQGAGVLMWDGARLSRLSTHEGLPTNNVWSLLADSWGGLWVGTADRGLLRRDEGAFEQLATSAQFGGGVPQELARTSDGGLWVATSGVGAFRLDEPCLGAARPCPVQVVGKAEGLPHALVRMVLPATQPGQVWLGTRVGPALWNGGSAQALDEKHDPFPVRGMVEADGGALYVANKEQGLVRFEPVNDGWRAVRFPEATEPTPASLWSLTRDDAGTLWAGGTASVFSFDGARFTRRNLPQLASTDRVVQLLFDGRGRLWFRSDEAVGTLDNVLPLPRTSWLVAVGDDVIAAAEDGLHRLSASGTVVVDVDTVGQAEGYPASAANASGAVVNAAGEVLFGATNGLYRFDPKRRPQPARVHLISVAPLDDAHDPTLPLRLTHDANDITARVDALAFPSADSVQLRYRLEGLDVEWSQPTTSRQMQYRNLAPGRYAVHVQARHGASWSDAISSAPVEVLPAFWQTWWFRLAALFVGLALVLAIPLLRARALRVQRDQLTRLVTERTAELARYTGHLEELVAARTSELRDLSDHHLAELEQERRAMAHDLHDDLGQLLGSMQMELYYLMTTHQTAAASATDESLARLQLRIDELGQNLRRTLLRLRPRILDDLGLVPALDWLCESLRRPDGMSVVLEVDRAITAPREVGLVVFRIAQEALSNALKHSQGSEVSVRLRLDGAALRLEVTDDGVGLPSDVKSGPTRFGLLGMAERARTAGGTLTITSLKDGGTQVLLVCEPTAKP